MHQDITPPVPSYLAHSDTYTVIVTDLQGNYTYVNKTYQKRFSFVTDDFIGKSSFIAIYEGDHASCIAAIEKCLIEPDKSHRVNLRKPNSDLTHFHWSTWDFSLLRNDSQAPVGIICIGYDITESERTSQQALVFASKVETILEEITEGFYQVDNNWNMVRMNRVAEEIIGSARKDVLNQPLWDVFGTSVQSKFIRELQSALDKKENIEFENYHPAINKWICTVAYPSPEGLTVFFRDITRKHKDRAIIALSENKLKAILDSSDDSILLISPDFLILNFNKTAKQLYFDYFGKQLEVGISIINYISDENRTTFEKGVANALAGTSSTFEIQEHQHHGATWFETIYHPVYNDENMLIGVTINSRCINEKKKSELKIRNQEFMLRAIYHSTSEASTFIDTDLKIRYSNQVAKNITLQIFGKAEKIGDDVIDYVLPEYKEEFKRFYLQALAGEQISLERPEGQNWWHFLIGPVYDELQQIIGISHIVKNITSRKKREVQLRESEEKLQKNIEAIPHPLLIVDEKNQLTFVNEEFENVFGYTEKEVLGNTIDFLTPDRFREDQGKLFNDYLKVGGKSKRLRSYLHACAKNGREVVVDVSLNTFTANSQRFVIIILQDVTKLKKHQDTILKQNKALKKIAWQQSHEVRRPVANILGMSQLLKNDLTATDEDKNEYLNHLLESTVELDSIIHKIVKESNDNGLNLEE